MFPSRRARRLVLALAATSLVAAPGTAAAMPAGPDAPAGEGPLSAPPEAPARVADPLGTSGDDIAVLLAAGALAVVAAGGATLAHRSTHPFPNA